MLLTVITFPGHVVGSLRPEIGGVTFPGFMLAVVHFPELYVSPHIPFLSRLST